ncbi:hypothetical protein EB001_13185, partial [bacterium]|nr:hypothetical protein [bacterium]
MGNAASNDQRNPRRYLNQFYHQNGANLDHILKPSSSAKMVAKLCEVFNATPSQLLPLQMGPPMGEPMGPPMGPPMEPPMEQPMGPVTGGVEATYGGLEDLQNYGNTMFSKAKEKLIRLIAKDVFHALKVTGVKNAETAPIEDVVSNLAKLLPPDMKNPKKFHDNFNKSSKHQHDVIKALADAINRHFTGALIDVNADDPNEMASKVYEVINSLLHGLHSEFINVAGDVMRAMNNMQVVQNYLEAAYKKQKELIDSSGDPRLRDQSASTDEVYKTVKAEYERQAAILANLLNVSIGPTGKSLISSLEDSKDFTGLVKDLRTMVGTKAFGDKLAFLLTGVSSLAHSAALIDKALKKVGMSVAEFKNAKDASDVRHRVFKHIMDQSPNSKQLDEMMAAARIIYEANYEHDAVSKLLGKEGGGDGDGASESDGDSPVQGGDDDDDDLNNPNRLPNFWQKRSLTQKIKNKEKYRNLVLKDFKNNLKTHYQHIVNAANTIGRNIGEGITLNDDLKMFVDAFSVLPDIDNDNLHIALSGYAKDSVNKERREKFMGKFHLVLRSLEPLTNGPQGSLFKNLGVAIDKMLQELDMFADKMVKALTEIHIDNPEEVAKALRKTSSTFYGSGDGGDDLLGSGSWVPMDKVRNEMTYFYNIANVKTNLARAHADMRTYADDYDQLLGEEAAWLIDNIKTKYLAKIEGITEANIRGGGAGQLQDIDAERVRSALETAAALGGAGEPGVNVDINGTGKPDTAWALANLKNIWRFQMNAKVNMVKVAQAVDMYLKAFTDGMAKNPDSLTSIVKMLNEVDIVAKWFNDRSGDNLASLFEVFPNSVGNRARASDNEVTYSGSRTSVVEESKIKIIVGNKDHYYQYLEARWHEGATAGQGGRSYDVRTDHYNLPGNPFLGRPLFGSHTKPVECKGIITLSQKVVKSMRALENILSAFASVGAKLGDVDPLAKTFMTPGQIFNALCDYVAASAFSTEFMPQASLTGAAYHSFTESEKINAPVGRGDQTIPTNNQFLQYRVNTVAGPRPGINWSQATVHNYNVATAALTNNEAPLAGYQLGTPRKFGILTGVNRNHNGTETWRKYGSLAMSAIPSENTATDWWKYHNASNDDIRLDLAGWRDNFYDTDNLFQMSIKSIVAKIFTVVDAYRLFNRPVMDRRVHYSLNPLRTILGGGTEGGAVLEKVKVIPEALELYYRLVLLAEWYREQFGVKSNQPPLLANWRIALVPSIDGVWSDFVDVIFDKAEYVKEGNYTETQVQRMVLSMNEIWKSYKARYPNTTVRSILNAFVLEMNRAFGFLKQDEIDDYLKNRRDMLAGGTDLGLEEKTLDYDILNAENQFGSRPAPSDRFSKVSAKPVTRSNRNMVFLQQAVEELRKRIDADFLKQTTNLQNNGLESTSHFQDTLRNYRLDMVNAKSDKDEYDVVLRMLQSSNKATKLSVDKLIIVHELVAAPLAVLYAVYKVLARFNALLHGCSLKNLT